MMGGEPVKIIAAQDAQIDALQARIKYLEAMVDAGAQQLADMRYAGGRQYAAQEGHIRALEEAIAVVRKVVADVDKRGWIDEGLHDLDDEVEGDIGRIRAALRKLGP